MTLFSSSEASNLKDLYPDAGGTIQTTPSTTFEYSNSDKGNITKICKDSQKHCTQLQKKIEALTFFDKYSVLKEKLSSVFRNHDNTIKQFSTQQLSKIQQLHNISQNHTLAIFKIIFPNYKDTLSKNELREFGFAFQEAIGMKRNTTNKKNKADGVIGKDTLSLFVSLIKKNSNKKDKKVIELNELKDEKNTKSVDKNKSIKYMKKRLDNLSSIEKSNITKLYGTGGLYNKQIAEILGFKKIFTEKSTQEIQKKLKEFGSIFQNALDMQNIDSKIGSVTLFKFLQKYNSSVLEKIKTKNETKEKILQSNLSLKKLKSIDMWEIENISRNKGDKDKELMNIIQKKFNIDFKQMNISPDECARFIQKKLLKMQLKKYGYIGNLTLEKLWMRKIETPLSGNAENERLQIIERLEKFDKRRYKRYKKYMKFSSRIPKITKNGIKEEEIQNLEKRLSKTRPFKRLQKRLFQNKQKGLLLDYKTKNLYVVRSNEKGFVYEKVYKIASGARGHRTPKGIFQMGKMRKGGLGKVLSYEDRMSPAQYNKKFKAEIALGKRSKRTKQKYSRNAYIPSVQSGKVTVSTLFYPIQDGVGIHATNKEQSITMAGASASHGCIRMYHADLIDLYYQNNEKNYHSIAIA